MATVVLLPEPSMGVSPPEAEPLRCVTFQEEATMTPAASLPSRFAVWRSLESRADRLASYGALAFAFAAVLAYVLF